ncbi:hypothetical protein MHBO_000947 [Bonamia ostreae]|uniref:Uncharacterized protein n=1 Tax=Bonamia ostreae TaxID=126728 RepID=A0ABV2AHD8_9EUKA
MLLSMDLDLLLNDLKLEKKVHCMRILKEIKKLQKFKTQNNTAKETQFSENDIKCEKTEKDVVKAEKDEKLEAVEKETEKDDLEQIRESSLSTLTESPLLDSFSSAEH